MKDPHTIIIRPRITEKARDLSYGDVNAKDETQVQRSYTFMVANDANKIEIKDAIEAIYNAGKKDKATIKVASVRTTKVYGKMKGRGRRQGMTANRKKAVVTLMPGQMLEDYGV